MPISVESRRALTAAAVVVLAALIALVGVNVLLTMRVDRITRQTERLTDTARRDLKDVNHHLSREIAALTRYTATGDSAHLADFRTAAAGQQRTMRALAKDVRALGVQDSERFAALVQAIRRWRATVDRYVAEQELAPVVAPVPHAPIYREPYPAVIDAVHALDEEIGGFQSARREQVRSMTRVAVWLSAALVLVAAIAGWTVLRLTTQLRAAATALADEADERMAALEREREIRRTAEALVRSRDEILGVVSHDLRTPLTAIALSSQILDGSTPEERAEHVATIQTSVRRMQRLIQDLLDVTRIENSSLSIRRESVDPARVAQEVVAEHRPLAAEKKIDLLADIDAPLPTVAGDYDRLVQVLTNLVGNALKFTPEGGKVRVAARAEDRIVRFTVADSGPGIAESDLPHLFEPFFQSKKTAHLGAGLGLMIVRAIVEAHGGNIRVTNQAPRGACFTVDIPAE
ncbi:MAG: sensor histidine kinase [Thermoanaerobaculia bacterium]